MSKYERKSPRIVAELLDEITSGKRAPGEQFLTTAQLAEKYDVSQNTASGIIKALKTLGALSGKSGGKTWVRVPPVLAKRDNRRYWDEKNLAAHDDPVQRGALGVSEYDTGIAVDRLHHNGVSVGVVEAPEDVAAVLGLTPDERVRRVVYERRHHEHGGLSRSTSYVPYSIIKDNPDLLDPEKLAKWPGGLMNELRTVGVEAGEIVDHVTVTVPTAEESHEYDIPPGVPLIHIRKVTYDIDGRPVEVADIPLPGDRVELIFRTPLPRWSQ